MKIRRILLVVVTAINPLLSTASTIDTLTVQSKSMNRPIANVVITPDSYKSQKEGFNVLYLLHGAYGNHEDWVSGIPDIKEYADQYNIIIVCPNGGFNSWYFDSPKEPEMRYETYVSKELVGAIDKKYKTKADKSARAITGLSMGGHGAFYLSFRHPDVWGTAGSMSGGLDLRPFPDNWDIKKRLGDYSENKQNWEENSVINMVHLLTGQNLKLMFDCGVDDFFYGVNKRLHQKLVERNIPHDYIERPGKHDWDYWANAIKYQLVFFDAFFNSRKTE